MTVEKVDPLVGHELIRVSMETFSIHFDFLDAQIQIGSDFIVRRGEQVLERLFPLERTGNIGAIWSTIGTTVAELIWADSASDPMVVTFSDGIIVEVLPFPGRPRGTILGFYDGKHTVDNF